jgi:hypothetical protein
VSTVLIVEQRDFGRESEATDSGLEFPTTRAVAADSIDFSSLTGGGYS